MIRKSPTEDPFATVFAITYNQSETVELLLHDLMHQQYPSDRYEIIVLDDGSRDNTLEKLTQLAASSPVALKLVRRQHEEDYMSAKRWNQCIHSAESKSDVFVQIDDVRVRPDFITQHVKWHLGDGDWLVTGAKFEGDLVVWDLSRCRRRSLAGPNGAASQIVACRAVWAASLSFTRRSMERVCCPPHDVPYDERMIGWGYHEVEFALRMQRVGVRLVYDPAAGVFHRHHTKETETARGLCRDELVENGEQRNIQYILAKHGLQELERW